MRFVATRNDVISLGDRNGTGIRTCAAAAANRNANAGTGRAAGRNIARRRPAAIAAAAADRLGRDTVGTGPGRLDDAGRRNRHIISVSTVAGSTTEPDIDRSARSAACRQGSRESKSAIAATAANRLRQNAVRNIAEGEDCPVRCDHHIAVDDTATTAITAK